jgi:hypothetical protein
MSRNFNPIRAAYSLFRRLYWTTKNHLRAYSYLLRPGVTLLEGTEKKTGERIRICYAGFISRGFRVGFPSQILTSIDRETFFGRKWLWKIRDIATRNDCSFLLVESPAVKKQTFSRLIDRTREPFFIPYYVKTDVQIADMDRLLHKNKDLKTDLQRVRAGGFEAEITHTPKDYRIFLEEHYQSYSNSNYGSCAMGFEYDFLRHKSEAAQQAWELIKVSADGEWLAGLLVRKDRTCANAMEVGVKGGDPGLVKRGTLAAAYWFFVQRAKELGYSEVSFMLSPPFPRNGVLQFKSKYRPTLSAAPSAVHGLLYLPLKNSALIRQILLDQPFFSNQRQGSFADRLR